MPRAERIMIDDAILITGYSRRTLQRLASAGKVPGAGRPGAGCAWTFDEAKLRQWVMSWGDECRREEEERLRADLEKLMSKHGGDLAAALEANRDLNDRALKLLEGLNEWGDRVVQEVGEMKDQVKDQGDRVMQEVGEVKGLFKEELGELKEELGVVKDFMKEMATQQTTDTGATST